MRFFNWLFGCKKSISYTPFVEFGTGASVKLPQDVNEFVKFTKNSKKMGKYEDRLEVIEEYLIDPNHPAHPIVLNAQYTGLTIRAEIASRLMAAMFANPAMANVESHILVAAALGGTDLLIKQLNETT